jgi:Polyketide cyclase / dehydrase and lipid transport
VEIEASAAEVWSLIAEPARWHEWSPCVAGGEGLGTPEVEAGAKGSVVLRGGLRINAEILEVVPGQSWTWQVKGLRIRHEVESIHPGTTSDGRPRDEATPRGSRLSMTPEGNGPFWAPAALAYRLPTALIARNIARLASRPHQATAQPGHKPVRRSR